MAAELDLAELEKSISATRFGGSVRHLRTTGSTNQEALEAALAGARTGLWVADEQTAGRGRGGHDWHSAAGDGLYVSALAAPGIRLDDARMIPLATGLAAQAAIAEVTGLDVDIRWPNDLMLNERKCGGILVESVTEPEPGGGARLRYAVIGVGINLNQASFPRELRELATSLHIESGRWYEREPLLAALLVGLDRELRQLESRSGDVLERFAAASSWVRGRQVRVEEQGGYTGVTCGLDAQGFLLVEDTLGKVRTVLSGGVRPR